MDGRCRSRRVVSGAVAMVIAAMALCASSGCSSGPTIRIDSTAPFTEPPLQFQSMGRNHIAVFTAPTGGWKIEHDETRRAFRVQQVFVTLRRPEPGVITTQALCEHAVDTGVETTHNVAVYARVLVGRDAPGETPYRLAGEATPNPPAN